MARDGLLTATSWALCLGVLPAHFPTRCPATALVTPALPGWAVLLGLVVGSLWDPVLWKSRPAVRLSQV